MTITRHSLLVTILMIVVAGTSFAQTVIPPTTPTNGRPPFGSLGGAIDTINLANLNSNISIPVVNKKGRNVSFDYNLAYNSSFWSPNSEGLWQPVMNFGWTTQTAGVIGYLSYGVDRNPLTGDVRYFSYVYHDPLGTPHAFPSASSESSGPCSLWNGASNDGSGYTLLCPSWNVVDRSGRVIVVPNNTMSGPGTDTDSNGNQIGVNSSGIFTDTLGTTALTVTGAGTPSSPNTFTYTAASGGQAQYIVKYQTYMVQTNFGCISIAEYGPTSQSLVSEIDLPDNTKYTFTYEATPQYSGNVTGRLASVTLPTGGTISYTYTGGSQGIVCADGSAATLTRTTPDGTWTYAHSEAGTAWTTTVTDPQNNQTVLNFQGIYQTQSQVYQGSTGSGTLLDTTYTCYNSASYPCNSTLITLPITKIAVTNSWASGQTSQTVANYNTYGLPTEVDEYGYGNGTPGSLVRQTLTSYSSLGNNINDRPASTSIYAAGASSPSSQTSYTYDQGSMTATTGTPQHVAVSGSRGNPTTVNYLISGSSSINTTATYFDTGMIQTSTDSNGNQTAYSYGTSSCGNSFPTSITMLLNLSRSQSWNCNGALIASGTDENGQVTSYTYDLMNRPVQTNFPDVGWELINYTSANQHDTYTGKTDTTASTSCTSCEHDQENLDSQGREATIVLVSDPEGQTTTSTVYDSLGRIQKTSNPYRSPGDPTYGFNTSAFDALNRITSLTHPDSNVVTTYYGGDVGTHGGASSQLCASGTYGLGYPTLTKDESGMKHQSWMDALSRTIEVDEPDSSNNLTLGTCHAYNALGNVTQTIQGSQTRTYAYDGLSRQTSEAIPEAGTTNLYYTTSGGGLCSGNPEAICRRTDARGITTTYSYDALNRPTSQTYSDSTPAANSYYDESSVTVAGTMYTLANTKGRVSHTSAASGTALTIHSYDPVGRTQDLWQCTPYNCSNASIWKVHYTYDLAGDLTGWQHPAGETITRTISNAGRVTQIASSLNDSTHPGILAQNIHYAPQGATSSLQDGCAGTGCTQRQETYDYNNRLQPVRLQLGTSASNNANSCLVYNYYSGAANPSTCSIPSQGSSGNDGTEIGHYFQDTTNSALGHTTTYTYDNLNRLNTSVAAGSSTHNLIFSYDRYGNMTCVTNQQTSGPCPNFIFNASTNQITGYTYDAAGNSTTDGTGHTYQWDAENRLKSIDGGASAAYTYNAFGQRVEKNVLGAYTEYVYQADGEEIGEHNRSSWSVRVVSFAGRHVAHYQGAPNATYFFHSDKLGSTSQATDYTGAVAQDQLYYPWGGAWNMVGTTQEKRFASLGHRDDTETSLDPTPFRMFSPTQGRWLSTDPLPGCLRDPQQLNAYTYVRNSPTTKTDPQGNFIGSGIVFSIIIPGVSTGPYWWKWGGRNPNSPPIVFWPPPVNIPGVTTGPYWWKWGGLNPNSPRLAVNDPKKRACHQDCLAAAIVETGICASMGPLLPECLIHTSIELAICDLFCLLR